MREDELSHGLRGGHHRRSVEDAVELMRTFRQHLREVKAVTPFVRFSHGGASARVHDEGEDGLYLTALRSSEPGKGHAREVMKKATDHADSLGKKMSLVAIPDRDEDYDRLTKMYRDHGFEHQPGTRSAVMTRKPRKAD